ncbi:MAG: DUF2244 domain-containing protein [Hyphomonas sp.]
MTPMNETAETIYMDAVLTPNRSLSPQGFRNTILAIGAGLGLMSLMFLSIGAFPVLGFFGLDLLAIWFALRWSIRKQQEETHVRVTAKALTLHHRDAKGREKHAELPSAFTRVEMDEPVGPQSWLRIEHGNSAWVIGRFLTPDERAAFAGALRGALAAARAERYPA